PYSPLVRSTLRTAIRAPQAVVARIAGGGATDHLRGTAASSAGLRHRTVDGAPLPPQVTAPASTGSLLLFGPRGAAGARDVGNRTALRSDTRALRALREHEQRLEHPHRL